MRPYRRLGVPILSQVDWRLGVRVGPHFPKRPLWSIQSREKGVAMLDKVKNWDAKALLAGLVLILYFGALAFVGLAPIPDDRLPIIREMLVVIGPIVGMGAHSIWRNSRLENINAAASAEVVRAAVDSSLSQQPYAAPEPETPRATPGADADPWGGK